jgi:hypothetical protein
MSKLLIQESPLTFQPSLAKKIGLNEAIVLQQIHYWIANPKNKGYEQDGYKWVYNTYAEWRENNFPFWSENTVQRVFTSLEDMGLVVAIQPMKGKYDRTKYYRIEYTKLEVFDDPNLVYSLNESETTAETNSNDFSETNHTAYRRGEQQAPDKVAAILEMANFPGAKTQARIDAILSYLGATLQRNTETKEWKEFAKYVDSEKQTKGWDVAVFIDWMKKQKGYDPAFWSCKRMREFYPMAFTQGNETKNDTNSFGRKIKPL